MIHSNGGAIFHRREQDAAVKRFETELQGLKGNRRFRRVGTETRELWATKVQGDRTRFRKRRATGVSGASETGSRSAGQPEFRRTGTAIQGQRATEVQEEPQTKREQPRATGVANGSTNRGDTGQPESPESGNEFQEATGDRSFRGTPGNRSSGKEPGNWGFQRAACRLAQGNGDGSARGAWAQALRPRAGKASGS